MAYEDETAANKGRAEHGIRLTLTVEWEREVHSTGFFDEQFAGDLGETLISVARLGADYKTNSLVTSRIEKLGEDAGVEMNASDFEAMVARHFPGSTIVDSSDGEIVIHTGLTYQSVGANHYVTERQG